MHFTNVSNYDSSGRMLQLPFGVKDPVKRLRAVQDAILNNGEVLHNLTFALFKFSGMLPTSIVTMNPPSGYTVDCTTIPGPEEPCYIAGCRMRNVFGSFASGPGGVGKFIITYLSGTHSKCY